MGALACKAKIILDSGSAAGYATAVRDTVASLTPEEATAWLTDEAAYPIIKQLIKAEHALEAAHNLLLDAVGYTGPRPNTPHKAT